MSATFVNAFDLSRNALAPSSRAFCSYSGKAKLVRTMTTARIRSSAIRRSTSRPLPPGMLMSRTTTAGRSRRIPSSVPLTSSVSATTDTPGTSRRRAANRSRTTAESSAISVLKDTPFSFVASTLAAALPARYWRDSKRSVRSSPRAVSEEFGQRSTEVTANG